MARETSLFSYLTHSWWEKRLIHTITKVIYVNTTDLPGIWTRITDSTSALKSIYTIGTSLLGRKLVLNLFSEYHFPCNTSYNIVYVE